MDKLSIIQWNSRSTIANKNNLEYLLHEHSIDIALISETWFKPQHYVNFPIYNVVRQDRIDGKGGVAVLIKNCLHYQEYSLPDIEGISSTFITFNTQNYRLNLVSLYVCPKTRISLNEWNRLFTSIPKLFHSAWGCSVSDVFGRTLLDSIDNNNLYLLNNGTLVTNPLNNKSAVDISICSPRIAHLFN